MTAELNRDISPDVLEIARVPHESIRREVRRAMAEEQAEPPPPDKVDKNEAARILGVMPRTIYAYREQGVLKPVRTGRRAAS